YLSEAGRLQESLSRPRLDIGQMQSQWKQLRQRVLEDHHPGSLKTTMLELFRPLDTAFSELATAEVELQFAVRSAEEARRSLDHKKFLDMHIDDVEEKFIDLVDGTRAQTANLDNYLGRLCTAL